MLQLPDDQRKKKKLLCLFFQLNLIGRSAISCFFVLLTQFALALVPRFFPVSSLLVQLPLSVGVLLLVVGFGRWCRRLVGVKASAPAFVFFNVLFICGAYNLLIRQAIPILINVVFNGEVVLLLIGLCSIISSDPGYVTRQSPPSDRSDEATAFVTEARNESSLLFERIRYCKSCDAYVKGFDHHCPAFGNCIGAKNHVLFVVLLVGFLITEISYVMCSSQLITALRTLNEPLFETYLAGNFITSTLSFALLQVLWQVPFLAWHIYCICFNIRTDEWINWRNYPEFHLVVQPHQEESLTGMRFTNPYDKGILQNLEEFLATKG